MGLFTPKSPAIDTVFFDLDGTLTDPKIGITTSIQYALAKFDVAVPTQDELTWCIGPPLHAAFKAAGAADARYTEYPDGNHNAWDAAYADTAMWAWLFAQKR